MNPGEIMPEGNGYDALKRDISSVFHWICHMCKGLEGNSYKLVVITGTGGGWLRDGDTRYRIAGGMMVVIVWAVVVHGGMVTCWWCQWLCWCLDGGWW